MLSAMAHSMHSGSAYCSSQLILQTLMSTPQTPIISADTSATAMGMKPGSPERISAKSMPTKALTMPRNRLSITISPQRLSLPVMERMPRRMRLRPKSTSTMPEMMPSVIVQAMAENACGSVMVSFTDAPMVPAAMVAAGSS